MSPLLKVNFDEVPDEYLPVPAGTYLLEVKSAPSVEPTKDGKSTKLVVQFSIVENANSQLNGRGLQDHISTKMLTQIKRLFLAAGITPGADGIDTEELAGKRVKATVVSRTYRDPDSQEERETSRISDYIVD